MPTPAFCALEEVYSDWNFKKPNQIPNLLQPQPHTQSPQHTQPEPPLIGQQGSTVQPYPQLHPAQQQQQQQQQQSHNKNQFQQEDENGDVYIPNNNGLRSFCPNCQNCVQANDVLQQRIIEQNIWPRPRWTPQYPNAYVPFDPFDRYWMNNVPQSHREDFGNVFENFGQGKGNTMSTETLLQVILFILIALFIIQLVECLYMRCTE